MGALIYYLVTLVMTSWPVWLFGGISCIVLWHVSKNWHPLGQLLSRSFLMALTFTPSLFEGHPPVLAPAIYALHPDWSERWFSKGVFPVFVGWLLILAISFAVARLQSACEQVRREHTR